MAITDAELRELLAAPAETLTLDFKRELQWADPRAKLEVLRDITCLANRSGGLLVYGVEDRAGAFAAVGLAETDQLPDVTEIAMQLARYFNPPPRIEVRTVSLDTLTYGVIRVYEFATRPHVCTRDGQVPGSIVLRPGLIYQRSDQLSCQVATADGVATMIDSAVAKTGAAYNRALGRPRPAVADDEPEVTGEGPSQRAVEIEPLDDGDPASSFKAMRDLLADATILARGGEFLPRNINLRGLDPGQVVRSPRGLRANHLGRVDDDVDAQSVLDVSRDWRVRYREMLWESRAPAADGKGFDVTTLVMFVASAAEYGRRLYGPLHQERYRLRLGILRPTGLQLISAQSRFSEFHRTYVATSPVDIWVERELEVSAFDAPGTGPAWVREVVAELLDYFGWEMPDPTFDAHLSLAREWLQPMPSLISAAGD